MKAVFNTTGSCPKNSEVELTTACDIPFIPRVGDFLSLTPNGDFLQVDEVFWSCLLPDEVEVYVTHPSGVLPADYLVRQGWQAAG